MNKGSAWLPSGATETGITPGTYVVEFSDVSGWTTPDDQDVTIVSNETAVATGTYVLIPTKGSLTVTLTPDDAVAAGAQWRRQGTATWFDSGGTESDIPAGTYTVEFKSITGWSAPVAQSVTITAGETAAVAGDYIQMLLRGSLRVTAGSRGGGDAAPSGGVPERRPWKNSGVTEDGSRLAPTVEFKDIPDWKTGAGVTVEANQTAQVTRHVYGQRRRRRSGGCPLFKAMQPFVDVLVYEPVLPATAGKAGLRECGPLTPLATGCGATTASLRIRCGNAP